jgi:hypothetical protein
MSTLISFIRKPGTAMLSCMQVQGRSLNGSRGIAVVGPTRLLPEIEAGVFPRYQKGSMKGIVSDDPGTETTEPGMSSVQYSYSSA